MTNSHLETDADALRSAHAKIRDAGKATARETSAALHKAEHLGASAGHKVFAALIDGVLTQLKQNLPHDIELLIASYGAGLLELEEVMTDADKQIAGQFRSAHDGQGTSVAMGSAGGVSGAGAAAGLSAAAYVSGPQHVSNSKIAEAAEMELRDRPGPLPTGWSQPGECMVSAQRWVEEAGGRVNRDGRVAGSYSGVANQVELSDVRRGDIIQYVDPSNPDGDWEHVHTVVVTGVNADGTFAIIERNYDFEGSIRGVSRWSPRPAAGWEARAYRYGDMP